MLVKILPIAGLLIAMPAYSLTTVTFDDQPNGGTVNLVVEHLRFYTSVASSPDGVGKATFPNFMSGVDGQAKFAPSLAYTVYPYIVSFDIFSTVDTLGEINAAYNPLTDLYDYRNFTLLPQTWQTIEVNSLILSGFQVYLRHSFYIDNVILGMKAVRFANGNGVNPGKVDVLPGFVSQDQLATVPEPTSWSLMIGGFTLIGSVLRKRSQRRVTV